MSKAEMPLMGSMSKSMGNFTTYTLNGMNIVRSKPFRVKDDKSKKQLNMRARMKPISKMYQEFSSIIALGFPERDVRLSPQNMFVSVNFNRAFVMKDETPVISYPLMLLAKGTLPPVTITEVTTGAEGLTLNYDALALLPDVTATDEIIACALLITGELLMARQFIGHEPTGTIRLNYPALQAEEVVCCYVFVRSGDGKKASESGYVEVNG